MQFVEIVLHFVVGQLAVDEVAEVVVVVTCAVVGFQTVVWNGWVNELFNQIYFQIS